MTNNPLSPNEANLLRGAPAAGTFGFEDLLEAASLSAAQGQSAAESLTARGLFTRDESVVASLVITAAGRGFAKAGIPELQLHAKLESGPQSVKATQDLGDLPRAVVGSAFGGLKKAKLIRVDKGQVELVPGEGWAVHQARQVLLSRLAEAGEAGIAWEALSADQLPDIEARLPGKRGKKEDTLFEKHEVRTRRYSLTEGGAATQAALGEAKKQVAELTAEMLRDGTWRDVEFRSFNFAEPPPLQFGRRNPYRAFLDLVKQRLTGLGFEEMTGSIVEPEFWNMDALFLPQFHPAREIHDVYYVEDAEGAGAPGERGHASAGEIEGGALEPVALEHEGKGVTGSRGWNYDFDRERSKRLVLRSQGTVLSARWLAKAKTPGKYFAMARCFRYDEVDATHAPDFFQVEGIVSSEQTSFRHLLGLLKVFAREMARSEEIQFVPAYFPFTEPSVEVHMKHPTLGWMELGGAGMFRPEVTRPHGIDSPVIAWGLGLDRMAMVALGIDDIRHLFSNNVPGGLSGLRDLVAR